VNYIPPFLCLFKSILNMGKINTVQISGISYSIEDSEATKAVTGKQDTLISGTNIKTINNESILGSGNIDIQGGGGTTYTAGTNIDITNDIISCTLNASNGFGGYSFKEGWLTSADGRYSHAEGFSTTARADYSHTEGFSTYANNQSEHASGMYNVSTSASTTFGDSGNTLFSVGNGTSTSARHNAFEIRQNGDIYLTKNGQNVKLQDQLDGYVTTNNEQTISGRKIFTYSAGSGKAIEFKQTNDSAKVGFRIINQAPTNNELASFELRPNTFTIDGVQHPLLYFGHYRNKNTGNAGVPQTVIGYRQYDQLNAAAYHYLIPLPEKAKTPFNLTTSFKDYYAPMGFKNGSTMITADDTGVVDLSSEFSGKVDTSTFETYSGSVDTALSGKQDTLSAGTNITIVDNVISAEGGGGKAVSGGTNISVTTGETADTINCTLSISAGTGTNSLIVGYNTSDSFWKPTASGKHSIAHGTKCTATYEASIATGYYNEARANYSIAQGYHTTTYGGSSHSEGWDSVTRASYSHAEGNNCMTSGESSHAEGIFTNTSNKGEHSEGWYNVTRKNSTTFGDSGNTLFSVGNGTAEGARHNAFEIRQNGDIYLTKDGQDVKLQDQLGGSSITVDTALDSGSTNPVENRVIYNKIDEVEEVTAAALNIINDRLSEDEEVTAAGLNALNDKLGGLKLVKLTQSAYDNLLVKDSMTLYIIVN
jgi:hypothetical protein